ncbi:MAG: Eco57I restriction-modification methylase domain-containing protein [Deltaproteobacteria bacterium]|jgi:hypothetical protein|nr:Eco57I restriction-modification methylase domain-containing protein [Deltaproteobacteria bacterium]
MGARNSGFNPIRTLNEPRETHRLLLQADLDAGKTIEERRKLGQFATPTSLAHDIVSFGIKNIDFSNKIKFFDPAFGVGAFYSALLDVTNGGHNILAALALEIDPLFAKAASKFWLDFNIKIINADFTETEPIDKYNFIICNPPYVRHHLIDSNKKNQIKYRTKLISGVELSGLSGLYCHFLLQSVQWMEEGALAGWLIPSEFMDVNYGRRVKEFLLTKVDLFRIHRFDFNDVQFEDALVSSTVIWFKKSLSKSNSVVFSFGGSLNFPKTVKKINKIDLYKESKWNNISYIQINRKDPSDPKLKDYFEVKRGIATGGNDFFIMEERKIQELELPFEFFRPILPSARFLKTLVIESDNFGNPILPKRMFLLDCRLNEYEIHKNYPNLWRYFESGRVKVANGYLCRARKCWYFQEQREVPLFVCTYMVRQTDKTKSAFRFILNNSKAIVSNSYLALYPKKHLADCISHKPELKTIIWESLNSMTPENIHKEGRIYGGGLTKIEPKELLNVSVPFLKSIVPEITILRNNRLF